MNSAECSKDLVGIHPQLRHTPPRRSSSKSATFIPSCEALIAATYPPGPPPIIDISYLLVIIYFLQI